jgi:hypothetical protein
MQKVADLGHFAPQPSGKSAGAAAEEPRQEHPSKKERCRWRCRCRGPRTRFGFGLTTRQYTTEDDGCLRMYVYICAGLRKYEELLCPRSLLSIHGNASVFLPSNAAVRSLREPIVSLVCFGPAHPPSTDLRPNIFHEHHLLTSSIIILLLLSIQVNQSSRASVRKQYSATRA